MFSFSSFIQTHFIFFLHKLIKSRSFFLIIYFCFAQWQIYRLNVQESNSCHLIFFSLVFYYYCSSVLLLLLLLLTNSTRCDQIYIAWAILINYIGSICNINSQLQSNLVKKTITLNDSWIWFTQMKTVDLKSDCVSGKMIRNWGNKRCSDTNSVSSAFGIHSTKLQVSTFFNLQKNPRKTEKLYWSQASAEFGFNLIYRYFLEMYSDTLSPLEDKWHDFFSHGVERSFLKISM